MEILFTHNFLIIFKLFSGPEDISNEKINSVPYASFSQLGRGSNALLVLEEEKNGLLKWTFQIL